MKKLMLGIASLAAAPVLAGLYGDTPDAKHAWAVHDWNRPKPHKVEPAAKPGDPPSDAIVLFDGTKESFEKNWRDGKGNPSQWKLGNEKDFYCVPGWKNGGDIFTRAEFGDCQLHLEYRHEPDVQSLGGPQMRGNSGVFLMGQYEIQVLESYHTSLEDNSVDNYTDGQAGAVYAENPPMVNPQRKPGEWQAYDIVFHQPVWDGNKLLHPGSVTVFFNGVLVQDHWEMEGLTTHCRRRPLAPHAKKGPLNFQDHGCTVHFRNVWYRPLPSRWDNKTHSSLSADEAEVMKLRRQTAGKLFAKIDLSRKDSSGTVQALMEVVSYAKDDKYLNALKASEEAYMARVKKMDKAELDRNRGGIDGIWNCIGVLQRNGVIGKDCPFAAFIRQTREKQGWK